MYRKTNWRFLFVYTKPTSDSCSLLTIAMHAQVFSEFLLFLHICPNTVPPCEVELLVIERTFYNFTLPKEVSEISEPAESAPCGAAGSRQPTNPRRW